MSLKKNLTEDFKFQTIWEIYQSHKEKPIHRANSRKPQLVSFKINCHHSFAPSPGYSKLILHLVREQNPMFDVTIQIKPLW